MRVISLAKIALNAQLLQIEQLAKRQGRRGGYGVVAAIFGIATLASGEFAAGQALMQCMSPLYAALIFFGINVVLTAVLAMMAARSSPSRSEQDAADVRNKAVEQMRTALTFATLLLVARTGFNFWRKRRRKLR